MHTAISTKVQGKISFETKFNNVNQTFDFLLFMWFLDFWHTRMKRFIKSSNVKTTKTDKAKITTIIITIVQQSSVWPTNKVTRYKQVKHTSYKRFKGLYQRQWSYGGIQTVDHRDALWRCLPFDCLVDKFKTHNSFFHQVSNEMVTYLYVLRFWMLDRVLRKIYGTSIITENTHFILRNSIVMK